MFLDNNFHVAHTGPIWVLSAPGGRYAGPINLAIMEFFISRVQARGGRVIISCQFIRIDQRDLWIYLPVNVRHMAGFSRQIFHRAKTLIFLTLIQICGHKEVPLEPRHLLHISGCKFWMIKLFGIRWSMVILLLIDAKWRHRSGSRCPGNTLFPDGTKLNKCWPVIRCSITFFWE